jgi:transcriptional antiterminator RfaH
MSEKPAIIDWHAVMSRPKAEHLAAAHLGRLPGVESYCPRIRFEKSTRRGRVWFVEALFPGYLFARFDPHISLRAVQASPQVAGVVRFGGELPSLPESAIADLMGEFSAAEPRVVTERTEPREGDTVEIVEGALMGMTALVTRVMPGRDRVRILLEWLGQQREAEVSRRTVMRTRE